MAKTLKQKMDESRIIRGTYSVPYFNYRDFYFSGCVNQMKPHYHDGLELFVPTVDILGYVVEGRMYELAKGDIILTNSNELHYPLIDTTVPYGRITLIFTADYFAELHADYPLLKAFTSRKLGEGNKIDANTSKKLGIDKVLAKLAYYVKNHLPESDIMIKLIVTELMVLLGMSINISAGDYTTNDNIKSAIKYINNNLDKRITCDDLSREIYVSKYYLSRLFKVHTGYSIGNYIMNKKIQRAKQLLIEGITPSAVAHMTGMGDYTCFYRAFKKATGISPSMYQREAPMMLDSIEEY